VQQRLFRRVACVREHGAKRCDPRAALGSARGVPAAAAWARAFTRRRDGPSRER
jgi:hypothetical protein